MSRSERDPLGTAPSGGRHLSPLTSYRRWRFRHGHPPGRHQAVPNPNRQSRLVARTALWTLLAGISLLVYLLAWQLINQELAADAHRRSGPHGRFGPRIVSVSSTVSVSSSDQDWTRIGPGPDQAAVDPFVTDDERPGRSRGAREKPLPRRRSSSR